MISPSSATARRIFFVCHAVGALLALTPASAATLPIFNTGVDAAGNLLASPGSADNHWLLGDLAAVTAIDPNNGWIANVSSGPSPSGWIGPNPQGPVGSTYTYIQTFFIPAGATGLSLSGQWATDDSATLFLNDQEILSARTDGLSSPPPWTVFQSFATDSTARFLPGAANSLRAEIVNTGGPTGFQAQFTGTYRPAEAPGPLPALGLAAAFTGSRRLRRRLNRSASAGV
jgi:hypothetical protein